MKLPDLNRFDWKHRAMHLGAVWALAFGKPILDATNESGFIFMPRSAAPVDIVLLAILVLFGPPLVMLAVEQLIGLASAAVRDGLHFVLIAAMVAVLAIQVLAPIGIRNPETAIVLSVAIALALTYLYASTEFMATMLDVLSAAPVVFLILYLFFSPATGLWLRDAEPAEIEVERDPPVVLIVLDEFPTSSLLTAPGKIDESLYPNFVRLAERATWYENATTVADQTTRAVPAILTGQRPEGAEKPVPTARAYPENIFTLLGDPYEIDAVETETQLCPRDVCERAMRDPFGERFGNLAGDVAIYTRAAVLPSRTHNAIFGRGTSISPLPSKSPIELFDLLLDDIDGEPGQLDMIHTANFPHKPWLYVPSGQSYEDPGVQREDLGGELLSSSGEANIEQRKRHLLQLGANDRVLGEVIDKLEAEGAWEEALVIVTADHGISFRPGTGRRRGTDDNLDQVAMVPFFVKLPGQKRGAIDPAPVETIDVVPTIAKALGVEIPWEVDGVPAGERTDTAIEMVNFKGRTISADLSALVAMQKEFVAEWDKLIKTGDGFETLIGSPSSKLLGKRVPEDPPPAEGSGDIRGLTDPDDSEQVSAVLGGHLEGVKPGQPLAVAINGKVAVATRAIAETIDSTYYEVVLPPSIYERPIERVQVLKVLKDGSFEQLASATP